METTIPVKKRRVKKWKITLLVIVVLLVVLRLILPYIVLKYVNKTLANLKEYSGHVEDIDIALIRGAYKINDIRVDKKDTVTQKLDSIPFFAAKEIDLSVEWRSIFKGKIVGEIALEEPVVNFVKGKHKDENVKADTADFQDALRDLMPLTINHFDISNGQIRYIDKYSKPAVDLALKNLQVKADNLSNVNDSNQVLPAAIKATAGAYDGKFELNCKFNALEKKPTFDMNAKISDVNMVKLNDFFRAYANFDVDKGNFGLYTEFAAKDGAFNGYVKPLITGMKLGAWNKENTLKESLWETLVAGVTELFENQKKDQVATKMPIKGNFENPSASLWTAISYVLRNAFVFALRPSVDNTIDIGKVEPGEEKKTFLQKVFGKKDSDKKDENKKDEDKRDKGKSKEREKGKENDKKEETYKKGNNKSF